MTAGGAAPMETNSQHCYLQVVVAPVDVLAKLPSISSFPFQSKRLFVGLIVVRSTKIILFCVFIQSEYIYVHKHGWVTIFVVSTLVLGTMPFGFLDGAHIFANHAHEKSTMTIPTTAFLKVLFPWCPKVYCNNQRFGLSTIVHT